MRACSLSLVLDRDRGHVLPLPTSVRSSITSERGVGLGAGLGALVGEVAVVRGEEVGVAGDLETGRVCEGRKQSQDFCYTILSLFSPLSLPPTCLMVTVREATS